MNRQQIVEIMTQIRGGHYLNWLSSNQLDWIVTETQVASEYWSQTWHGPTRNIQSLDLMKDLATQFLWAELRWKWLNLLDGLKVVVERRAKVIVHHHGRITENHRYNETRFLVQSYNSVRCSGHHFLTDWVSMAGRDVNAGSLPGVLKRPAPAGQISVSLSSASAGAGQPIRAEMTAGQPIRARPANCRRGPNQPDSLEAA